MMLPDYYEFLCPVKILCGTTALPNLPYEMIQLGAKKAMVITDQGVVGAGLLKHIEGVMKGSECEITSIYDSTPVDSSNKVVNEVAGLYTANGCDCIIALGGGSCIDTAKGVNIVVSQGTSDLMEFQGSDRLTATMKPFIVIPTTAGTGSEVTAAAVIKDVDRGVKMPFMADRLYPHVALIDPKMTMTMPPKITAATGMDALTHAVEAFINLQKNPISDAYASAAVEMIFEFLVPCVEDGKNEKARLAMANGATLAGIAFSNSMVGIVHALAHATGGVAHVPHGVANAIYLPWGMEYNLGKVPEYLAQLATHMGVTAGPADTDIRAQGAIKAVRDLNKKMNELCGLPNNLKEAGVKEDQLEAIAKAALNDGSCMFNVEDITYEDALAVVKKAF